MQTATDPCHHQREATAWAATVITKRGWVLFPIEHGAWDIWLPDGSWLAANDWRELCKIAEKPA